MSLTGPEIERQIALGTIRVTPYKPEHVGPNSIDLCLHRDLLVYSPGYIPVDEQASLTGKVPVEYVGERIELDMLKPNPTDRLTIPSEGLILRPGVLYLGRTVEVIGTKDFVSQVSGRSSVGRLGIQVHVTAGFVDQGFEGSLTLEITVVHPVRVYPNVRFCQLSFDVPQGTPRLYSGRYQGQVDPEASRLYKL